MIEYLRLHNVGIIRDAEIELGPGLTVLTGETGAGKTMVLTALNLLLGGKADSGLASSGDTRVQGGWLLAPDHPVIERIEQAGGIVEAGELMFSRTLPANGRSRCAAGGAAIPLPLLAEWGEQLVAVHGQSDQLLLRREPTQRAVLDRYAGKPVADAIGRYGEIYEQVRSLDAALAEASEGQAARAEERARLQRGLGDIETTGPQPGEDEQLAEKTLRLANVEELVAAASRALAAISADGESEASVEQLTANARRSLESVASLDPELSELGARMAEIGVLAGELGIDLARYLSDLDAQPGELEAAQSRRAELSALTRQYGPTIDDVLAWSQTAAERVFEIDRMSDTERLAAERNARRADLAALAGELSSLRVAAAETFCTEVSQELRGLSMPDAKLVVLVRPRMHKGPGDGLTLPELPETGREVGFGPDGVDEVQFQLVPHRGGTPAPLAKAASGGELSRVMLALEVVLADSASAPTFVFDEVDAGVGGRAAVEVGRRLAQLGRSAQVIVVTHLPQVAAFADCHLVVSKQSDGHVTSSCVLTLSEQDRVRELARMLAGRDDSSHAAAHASELLDLAQLERANGGARV